MAEGRRSRVDHQRRSGRWRPLAKAEGTEYDRVLFFSDAVFAIAITLLIVDLQVPDVPNLQSGTQLRESVPQMAGFALSFAVIGLFWIGHHSLFRRVKGLLRILASPVVFLLSIPVAIAQPVLAQYLWLLALFSALMIRRLEPPEPEPTTAEREPR